MNKPIPHQWAEVLIGIAEGKTAQTMTVHVEDVNWFAPDLAEYNPLTHPHWIWRLKPEPKVVKVRLYHLGTASGVVPWAVVVPSMSFKTEAEAERWAHIGGIAWLSPWTDIEVTE